MSNLIFLVTFSVIFYVLGAAYLEAFVNYRTWGLIGAAEFKAHAEALGPRVVVVLVIPYAIGILLTVALLWIRPTPIPLWGVWLSLGFDLIAAFVTLRYQVPTQLAFHREGRSLARLERLIFVEWFRITPMTGNAILFFWLLWQLLLAPPVTS
jgi:hypothetical protein